MTTSKTSLFTQIEDVLARNSANVSVNLINIAQIFAQLDQRLAVMETKMDRLLAAPPTEKIGTGAVTNSGELIALLDQRIKAALEREQRVLCEATADVARSTLREFVDEFKEVRGEVEAKLIQLRTLLAQRMPLDPRPN